MAGVVLLGVTGACTGEEQPGDSPRTRDPAASQTTAPAPAPPPAVGACYDLAFDAAVAPTSDVEPTDCARPHTSETVAVGTIDAVVGGHLLAVDSEHVQEQVASACPQQLIKYVGGTPRNLRLSMIRPTWYTPTVEQSDEGADWYRCDAVVLAGADQLAKVTGSLKGALRRARPRPQHAMCGTAAPDAKDFRRVPCSAKHSWRAIDVVTFKDGAYPGLKKVRAAGRARCEDAGADVAEDPLDFKWGYEWPTKAQWDTGQTYGRCWAPD